MQLCEIKNFKIINLLCVCNAFTNSILSFFASFVVDSFILPSAYEIIWQAMRSGRIIAAIFVGNYLKV